MMASILQTNNVFDSRFPSHSQYERLATKRAETSTDGLQPFGWNGVNNIWQPRAQAPLNGKQTGRDQSSASSSHEQNSGFASHDFQSSRNASQWTRDSSYTLSGTHLGPVIPPVKQKHDDPAATIPTSLSLTKSGLLSGSNPDVDPISQHAPTQRSIGQSVPPNSWHKIREFQPLGVLQNGQQITQGRFSKPHPHTRNIPSFASTASSADGANLASRHFPDTVHLQQQGFVTDEYRSVRSNTQVSSTAERKFGFDNSDVTFAEEALPAAMHNLNLGYPYEQPFEDENRPPAVGQFQSHLHREFRSGFFPVSTTSNGEQTIQSNGLSRHALEYRNPYNQRFGYVGLKDSASPSTGEFRSKANTPYFSTTVTPPASSESHRSNSASVSSTRGSHSQVAILDQRLKHLEEQQDGYFARPNTHENGSSFPVSYDYGSMPTAMRPQYYALNQQLPGVYSGDMVAVERQNDASHVMRSPLLEDFRTNSKTQRYELKDIYNHVVEFSGDQHGSRFIQQKLETANSDEKDQIFNEVAYDSLQLMTDVFGNYVIQKMFEHGNQSQKKVLANYMKGHVLALSMQMYGCRVVQKALDHILTDQQASLIKELDGHVLKVVENQNGNHVIQKAIERVPGQHIQFIVDAHRGHVYELSKHAYGCRVIQRMLEHCQPHAKRAILDELQQNIGLLIKDSFGNYVVQHVIVNGELKDRRPVIDMVSADLLTNSKHKFASNVVEKAIDYAEEEQRNAILQHLTTGRDKYGQTHVLELLTDQYGNYVIQKCLSHLKGIALQDLIFEVEQYLIQLRRVSSGKQVGALEISVKEARQRLELERSGNNVHMTGQQW